MRDKMKAARLAPIALGNNAIRLTLEEQKCFLEAILRPPQVSPALRKAMNSHERLISA